MSVGSTATVSLLSIGTDTILQLYNYGGPSPSVEYLRQEGGLSFVGTVAGVGTTIVSGTINSTELGGAIEGLKSSYDKKLAKVMIASAVINVKMLTQLGVGILHSIVMGNSAEQLAGWSTKQFLPSLFIHGIMAGTIPYFM